jgi:periplasmic protein TonB
MAIRANLVALALLTGLSFGQGSVQEIPRRSAPVPIHTADPEYTEEARSAKIEGAVLIQLVIDENGIPTEPKVVRSLDKGLDEKAIEAVKKWRFKPALKDGKPVSVAASIEINFRLLK